MYVQTKFSCLLFSFNLSNFLFFVTVHVHAYVAHVSSVILNFTRMCTCIFIGIVFLALINQFILLYPVFAHVYIFWSSRGGNFAALSCAIFIINQFTVLVDHDVP